MNAIILIQTTVAPVGVSSIYEDTRPIKKHTTDKTDEQTITALKLLNTLIEVRAGKIIRLDMRSVPIILIPTTTVIAVSTAIRVL